MQWQDILLTLQEHNSLALRRRKNFDKIIDKDIVIPSLVIHILFLATPPLTSNKRNYGGHFPYPLLIFYEVDIVGHLVGYMKPKSFIHHFSWIKALVSIQRPHRATLLNRNSKQEINILVKCLRINFNSKYTI